MLKFMLALVVGASALAFIPQPVAAASCTDQYTKCLNDTWWYEGAMQTMADLECAAEYASCIGRKLLLF